MLILNCILLYNWVAIKYQWSWEIVGYSQFYCKKLIFLWKAKHSSIYEMSHCVTDSSRPMVLMQKWRNWDVHHFIVLFKRRNLHFETLRNFFSPFTVVILLPCQWGGLGLLKTLSHLLFCSLQAGWWRVSLPNFFSFSILILPWLFFNLKLAQ